MAVKKIRNNKNINHNLSLQQDLSLMSAFEIMDLLGCSERSAYRYKKNAKSFMSGDFKCGSTATTSTTVIKPDFQVVNGGGNLINTAIDNLNSTIEKLNNRIESLGSVIEKLPKDIVDNLNKVEEKTTASTAKKTVQETARCGSTAKVYTHEDNSSIEAKNQSGSGSIKSGSKSLAGSAVAVENTGVEAKTANIRGSNCQNNPLKGGDIGGGLNHPTTMIDSSRTMNLSLEKEKQEKEKSLSSSLENNQQTLSVSSKSFFVPKVTKLGSILKQVSQKEEKLSNDFDLKKWQEEQKKKQQELLKQKDSEEKQQVVIEPTETTQTTENTVELVKPLETETQDITETTIVEAKTQGETVLISHSTHFMSSSMVVDPKNVETVEKVENDGIAFFKEKIEKHYPKSHYKHRFDVAYKAWNNLDVQDKEELHDCIVKIKLYYREIDPKYRPNLVKFIKNKKWKDIDFEQSLKDSKLWKTIKAGALQMWQSDIMPYKQALAFKAERYMEHIKNEGC